MGRNLDASDFLQNTIYIGIKLPSEREIERLSTLADLYGMIGFKRKEAFYKRVAAMYCVADQNNSEARWQQCFSLLRESLPGFSLEHVLGFIKSSEYETDLFLSSGESTGWPAVQARVLHELAFSARKIGDTKLAIKLLSGLLHSTHSFLNKSEQEEMLQALKNYSSACREESEILYEPICLPSFVNVVIPTGNGDPNLEPIEVL
ncbi:Oidioi.mRNA.OKI2018_I69.XSR.g13680.t3.cds [Oikopleura dioica]|uniref:Oidioi.mRNA.OKI2018_I69.XSR.g13680.t3.cds n=1 Tax=Oikopleura dioica TaxID=34765 RepID=A0ABN7SBC2_OIKDI|nr:Oidioi.mRNA.OKI2018_I69.XSR.g13680.t3.cds [Oikopleura dioica]